MTLRRALLGHLAARLDARPAAPVLRVAIDGVDGAGKTTFADELAAVLRERGRASPEGFYRDSSDYAGLRAALLDLLGPGGSPRYRTAIFDHVADSPVDTPELRAEPGSILLLDGLFLHRPELRAVQSRRGTRAWSWTTTSWRRRS